jgi:crossover junction endodeoxyribonuclease RuvC
MARFRLPNRRASETVGLDGAKDAARSEAIRRWPSHAALFRLSKHDGRAEAALIAIAGLMKKGGAK